MKKIGFVVDSTFSIKETKSIKVVPLKVIIDNEEFVDGTFDYKKVVDGLKDEKRIKTSQPTPTDFIDKTKELFDSGFDYVIIMTLSKTLSGTYNSASLAKEILKNDNVYVVDTQSTIAGSNFIAEETYKFSQNNTIIDTLDYLEHLILNGQLLFTVDNLKTLVKNGRLSRVQGMIGNILKIKPILSFKHGVLEVAKKVRSKLGAIDYITNFVNENCCIDSKTVVRIEYIDEDEGALTLKDKIEQLGKNIKVAITGVISPVISAHVGLGALGVYLINY